MSKVPEIRLRFVVRPIWNFRLFPGEEIYVTVVFLFSVSRAYADSESDFGAELVGPKFAKNSELLSTVDGGVDFLEVCRR